MKKQRILLFLLLSILIPSLVHGQKDSLENTLEELDKAIARKGVFHQQRKSRIEELRKRLQHSADPNEQYNLYGALLNAYLHYQTDSALFYVNKKSALLPRLNKP